jgi:diguanylate cyclase (GGDEF)-like protein
LKRRFFTLLIPFLFCLDIFSIDNEIDPGTFTYKCYNSSNGMPQNSAVSFAQNAKGFVYIATQEGVVKFDGHSMDIFNTANLKMLPSNNITGIEVMKDDSVYIATNKGLVHYTKNAAVIDSFRSNSFISGSNINSITGDKETGKIFGSIPGKGIFEIANEREPFFFDLNNELKHVKGLNKVHLTNSGQLYLAARNGLYLLNDERIFERIEGVESNIVDLSSSKEGVLWAVSRTELYNVQINGIVKTYSKKEGLIFEDITSVMADSQNTVWIGTTSSGMAKYSNGGFKYSDNSGRNKLRNIASFFKDRENNFWIGTEIDGFCIVKEGVVKSVYLDQYMILNISGDSKGNLWASTDGYGAVKIRSDKEPMFFTENIGNALMSVFADSKDRIWVSSRNRGVFVSEDQKKFIELKKIVKTKDPLKPLNTSVFFEDSRKTLWFNGRDNPSRIFYVSGNILSYYDIPADNATIVDIKENRAGEIIAATRKNGVFKLDRISGSFIKVPAFSENIFVHNILVDSKDRLWLSAHNDGVLIYFRGDIVTLNKQKGLFDNTVHAIKEDNKGNYWFTTNKGVFTISGENIERYLNGDVINITSLSINESDGMLSRECNGGVQPSVFISKSGVLHIPTIKGIVKIDPTDIKQDSTPPEISILWYVFDNNSDNRLRHIEGETLKVPAGTNTIEIIYSAPAFSRPDKIRFDYHINDKISAKKNRRRFASIDNLKPGNYQFNIKAYFQGSPSSQFSQKSLDFKILPFFYQTKKFQVSLVSILFLMFLLVWLMRKRAALEKEEETQRIINEKTYELQLKNNELEEVVMIDALTNLKNRRYLFEIEEVNIENFINSKERLSRLTENRNTALNSNLVYALIMLDIDHFKQINDHFGHNTGDLVLIDFAKLLQDSTRKDDTVIRWGGEEFLIILKDVKKEKINEIAEKIRKAVESFPFKTENGKTIWLTTSLGISVLPFYPQSPNLMSFESVLSITDLALYNSKNKGRDTCTRVIPGKNIPSSQEHLHGMLASANYADLNNFYRFERIVPDNFGEYDIELEEN